MVKVSVVGASGYVGGELLRILSRHPDVELASLTSRQYAGEYVHKVHPNLKGVLNARFTGEDALTAASKADVVFLALPHKASVSVVPEIIKLGVKIVDMSADFRLKDPEQYKIWYGYEHPYPELLKKFVYGLPELHRDELRSASYVAVPGCMAASAIISSAPLYRYMSDQIVVDAKIGSSGAGGKPSLSTHYSERYGVIRPYKPAGHRHAAEIEQELSRLAGKGVVVGMSAHAVNIVRGILTTTHIFVGSEVTLQDLWKAYREFYRDEPFVRFMMDRTGLYRYPDPKVVVGSNFADVGFAYDSHSRRIVALGAIDNLMKGAAGTAVQSMNLMLGLDEKRGLDFPAIHPV